MPESAEDPYAALGRHPGIRRAVDQFYERVAADASLTGYFAGADMGRLRSHVVELLAAAVGGPNRYTGRSMAEGPPGTAHHRRRVRPGARPPQRDARRRRRRTTGRSARCSGPCRTCDWTSSRTDATPRRTVVFGLFHRFDVRVCVMISPVAMCGRLGPGDGHRAWRGEWTRTSASSAAPGTNRAPSSASNASPILPWDETRETTCPVAGHRQRHRTSRGPNRRTRTPTSSRGTGSPYRRPRRPSPRTAGSPPSPVRNRPTPQPDRSARPAGAAGGRAGPGGHRAGRRRGSAGRRSKRIEVQVYNLSPIVDAYRIWAPDAPDWLTVSERRSGCCPAATSEPR